MNLLSVARRAYSEHSLLCNCIIILLAGSSPITWGETNSLLAAGVDFIFPLDPVRGFTGLLYAYAAYAENDIVRVIPLRFPYMTLLAALALVGLPIHLVQKISFILMFSLPGVSMLYFCQSITVSSGTRESRTFPEMQLISSLLYMLNPYVIALWRTGEQFQLFAYAILPLILALINKISSRPELMVVRCVEIALLSLLMATAASWLPIYIVAWAIIIFYCLVSLQRLGLRFAFKTTLIILVLSALTNAWWVVPSIFSVGPQFAVLSATPYLRGFTSLEEYFSFEIRVNASWSTLLNIVRLFGYWPWFQAEYGAYYQTHYGSVLLLLASSLFPVIAFTSALGRARRRTYGFLFLTLVGMFLAKSINYPFGVINAYLYERIPYGWMFLNNFQNFVMLIALGYSVLVAEGYKMCVASRPRFRIIVATFIVMVILINSHPVFSNQVYENTWTYQVPSYYGDLGRWLTAQGNDFKALPLPQVQVYESYDWGYSGPEVLHYFTGMVPLLFGTSGIPYETPFVQSVFDHIRNGSGRFIYYARLLHVRYILLDNSLLTGYNIPDAQEVRMILQVTQGVRYLCSFGKIDVYEIEDYIPMAYVPQRVHVLYGNLTSIPESEFPTSTSAFVLRDQVSVSILDRLSDTSNATILSYERQDACTFRVRVMSQGSFVLILGVPFSELWVAQKDGRSVSNHFMINGFANAWLINDFGTFSIEIIYTPQIYVVYGTFFSLLGLVFISAAVLVRPDSRRVIAGHVSKALRDLRESSPVESGRLRVLQYGHRHQAISNHKEKRYFERLSVMN